MTYSMQRDVGKDGLAKAAAIRFRRSRCVPDSELSGHEDISMSSLLAVAAAHRAGFVRVPAGDARIAA